MKKSRKQLLWIAAEAVSSLTLTAWLFFDLSWISLLLIFYLPAVLYLKRKEWKRKKKWELNLAFKDALVCLENSLAVGNSLEKSIRETAKSLEQLYEREHELCVEFRRMIKQMDLGGSVEDAFCEFGNRSRLEDIKQLADIFSVVKRSGGNLSLVLRQTGNVLQDKIELKRELHAAIAAKRMEFRVMCIVPYGILLYLKLFAPAMSRSLYHNEFGILFMWVAWLVCQAMKWLGEKIIRGELDKSEEKE